MEEKLKKMAEQLEIGARTRVEFIPDKDQIVLNIPPDGLQINGWKIIPVNPPVVSHSSVFMLTCFQFVLPPP